MLQVEAGSIKKIGAEAEVGFMKIVNVTSRSGILGKLFGSVEVELI